MKALRITFLLILGPTVFCYAQQVWLQPQKFTLSNSDSLKVNLLAGQDFKGIRINELEFDIDKLELHQGDSAVDVKSLFGLAQRPHLLIPITTSGTHLLLLQHSKKNKAVQASTFNDYLKAHDFEEAYLYRQQNNESAAPVHESNTTLVSLAFQVGNSKSDVINKDLAHRLEIKFEKNPYMLDNGDLLKLKIIWDDKPLFGCRVKIFNRHNNRTTIQNIYTEKDGTMVTTISNLGTWMVSVEKIERSTEVNTDWHSYFSSVVFGIQ